MRRATLVFGFAVISSIISASALAVSLDQALTSQTQTQISPVADNGRHIFSSDAVGVCGALGYSRVVSFTLEPCTDKEILYSYSSDTPGGSISGVAVQLHEVGKCSSPVAYWSTRLASVVCAR